MKMVERLLCSRCGPKKLIQAEMTFKRSPGKDDVGVCAFCHRETACKCYVIAICKDR